MNPQELRRTIKTIPLDEIYDYNQNNCGHLAELSHGFLKVQNAWKSLQQT